VSSDFLMPWTPVAQPDRFFLPNQWRDWLQDRTLVQIQQDLETSPFMDFGRVLSSVAPYAVPAFAVLFGLLFLVGGGTLLYRRFFSGRRQHKGRQTLSVYTVPPRTFAPIQLQRPVSTAQQSGRPSASAHLPPAHYTGEPVIAPHEGLNKGSIPIQDYLLGRRQSARQALRQQARSRFRGVETSHIS
jgi:hypothetical protein